MHKIVFDIETKNMFQEVGKNDPSLLDLSIVCIYDYSTDEYSSYLEEELPKLWPILEKCDMLIGYNSDHFDIPILNKYYPGDLTKIKSLDILKEIKDSFGRRLSLDTIAQGTLGTAKSANGLQAITWWRQGEIDKIRQYCLDDVKITKEVYDYALKNKELKFKDGPNLQTIKLDPSNWETREDSGMTFTLPF
jgi:DEAD/DEAH box helicase domain-containing protein